MLKFNTNIQKYFPKFIWIYLFPFLSFVGYNYVNLNLGLLKGLYMGAVVIGTIYTLPLIINIKGKKRYTTLFQLLCLSYTLSIFCSYIFRNQDLILGFRATSPYLAIIYFFILQKVRPTINTLLKLIIFFSVIYFLLWAYGMSKAPTVVFGDLETANLDESRGTFRLNIPGLSFVILLLFYFVNRFIVKKAKLFLVVATIIFLFIVLQLVRQIILWTLIIALFFMIRRFKFLWIRILTISVFLLIFLNFSKITFFPQDSFIGKMIEMSEAQVKNQKEGEDDIRVQEYKYFFSNFNENIITIIFGSGVPHFNSEYGREIVKKVREDLKYYFSDVGYAQMYVFTGIFGMIIYLVIFIKTSFDSAILSDVFFAKMFIIYQLFANISASWYSSDVICICICCYLLSTYRKKMNQNISQ